jgi:hypothetical protein
MWLWATLFEATVAWILVVLAGIFTDAQDGSTFARKWKAHLTLAMPTGAGRLFGVSSEQ